MKSHRHPKPPHHRPAHRRSPYHQFLESLEDRLLLSITVSVTNAVPVVAPLTGSASMVFTVTRSGDLTPPVSVEYNTADGTAHAGTDYTAEAGTLKFAANQTTATVTVPILADASLSASKSLKLLLSNPDIQTGSSAIFSSPVPFVVGGFVDEGPETITSTLSADINGDGLPDLIFYTPGSDNIYVYLNTTTPGSSTPTYSSNSSTNLTNSITASQPVTSMAVADVNGDGKPDLIVAYGSSATTQVFFNTTPAHATTPSFTAGVNIAITGSPGTALTSIVSADVNGDGLPDLINYVSGSADAVVYLNTTTPGSTTPTYSSGTNALLTTTNPVTSITAADVNGDGRPDLIVSYSTAAISQVFFNTTSGGAANPAFSAGVNIALSSGVTAEFDNYVSVDINGDGLPDLIAYQSGADAADIFLNTTTPGSTTPTYASANTTNGFLTNANSEPITAVNIADVNADGRPDLIFASGASGNTSIFFNSGATGDPLSISGSPAAGAILPAPAILLTAVSRKFETGAGNLDLSLPLTGNAGIEPRVGGPTSLIFTFDRNISLPGSFTLGLSSGAGTATVSGNTLTLALSGAADRSILTINLNNVLDPADGVLASYSLKVGVLAGDVNRDGTVNIADLNAIAGDWQKTVTTLAAGDLNGDGVVNIIDLNTVADNWQKSLSGAGSGSSSENAAPALASSTITTNPLTTTQETTDTATITPADVISTSDTPNLITNDTLPAPLLPYTLPSAPRTITTLPFNRRSFTRHITNADNLFARHLLDNTPAANPSSSLDLPIDQPLT